MKIYAATAHVGDLAKLRNKVNQLEDIGVAGVLVPDHLFVMNGSDRAAAYRSPDPFTLLSAIGALSDRLVVGTLVANVGFAHPALIIRHHLQLAQLYGGDRVLAGIGAGWNSEEFDAVGLTMAPHRERLDRLEAAAALARSLFDCGEATIEAHSFTARQLPAAPLASTPPRLMLGGGSTRMLDIAGRYADHVDVNGAPGRGAGGPAPTPADDSARRAASTIADLEAAMVVLEQAETAAGRRGGTVTRSTVVDQVDFCEPAAVHDREADICQTRGFQPRDLAQCPYIYVGDAARMRDLLVERRERLGLSFIIGKDSPDLARFVTEVSSKV